MLHARHAMESTLLNTINAEIRLERRSTYLDNTPPQAPSRLGMLARPQAFASLHAHSVPGSRRGRLFCEISKQRLQRGVSAPCQLQTAITAHRRKKTRHQACLDRRPKKIIAGRKERGTSVRFDPSWESKRAPAHAVEKFFGAGIVVEKATLWSRSRSPSSSSSGPRSAGVAIGALA